jgi:protease I
MLTGLSGSRVAILCTGDVEASEIEAAKRRLHEAGATPVTIPGDVSIDDARPADYAAMVLMGTCASADAHESDEAAVQFVREFVASDKPVGAIGNGARLLIAADAVGGRRLTSSLELAGEVHQAGGEWVDQAVEVDESLVTGRSSADLPVFTDRLVREFSRAIEQRQTDQLSEQSFPASDPPPSPISGMGKAREEEAR